MRAERFSNMLQGEFQINFVNYYFFELESALFRYTVSLFARSGIKNKCIHKTTI